MLVLVRSKGESILIGDNVEVCLLGVNGKEARIGINAPKDVAVDRREVRERKNSVVEDASHGDEGANNETVE